MKKLSPKQREAMDDLILKFARLQFRVNLAYYSGSIDSDEARRYLKQFSCAFLRILSRLVCRELIINMIYEQTKDATSTAT